MGHSISVSKCWEKLVQDSPLLFLCYSHYNGFPCFSFDDTFRTLVLSNLEHKGSQKISNWPDVWVKKYQKEDQLEYPEGSSLDQESFDLFMWWTIPLRCVILGLMNAVLQMDFESVFKSLCYQMFPWTRCILYVDHHDAYEPIYQIWYLQKLNIVIFWYIWLKKFLGFLVVMGIFNV